MIASTADWYIGIWRSALQDLDDPVSAAELKANLNSYAERVSRATSTTTELRAALRKAVESTGAALIDSTSRADALAALDQLRFAADGAGPSDEAKALGA